MEMSDKIRVLIVDDHEMVRMGLVAYLSCEEDIEIVGEASGGKQGVELALKLKPDVVLMDLLMEGMNGIEATKMIMEKADYIKVIVLTSYLDEERVFPAIEAGAFSYLLKTSTAEQIYQAIKKAMRGESVLEGKVTNLMINRVQRRPKHTSLTEREMEVLELMGRGKSNQEIGDILCIGIKTVKTHVSNILAKLELEDRTKVAIYANQHGLVK
jgi:two-component system, NarL family, response regulator LiaR